MEIKNKIVLRWVNGWTLSSLFLSAIILVPIVYVLTASFNHHFSFDTLISDFAINTYLLLGLNIIFTLFFAVPAAWLVSSQDFKFKSIVDIMMTLPLAIPAYISAYLYKGILGPFGTSHQLLNWHLSIDNLWGASLVISIVLYPYTYILCRSSFSRVNAELINAGRLMGKSASELFFKIAIPSSLPAILGGTSLILMESLNNYGAVSHLGLNTFSTEIYRHYSPMDTNHSLSISFFLLMIALVFLLIDQFAVNKSNDERKSNSSITQVSSSNNWLNILIFTFIPICFGFLIPITQLFFWAGRSISNFDGEELYLATINSCKLALIGVVVILIISIITNYNDRINSSTLSKSLKVLSKIGYAIPGSVIAIGILAPVQWINEEFDFLITGSLFLIIYAYAIRFISVGSNTIDSGFKKTPKGINQIGKLLGTNSISRLFKIELPLIRPSIVAATILIFIDILKELPMNLMFQQFNFETLSIKTYTLMETDGAIYQASLPALIIILISLIPLTIIRSLYQEK